MKMFQSAAFESWKTTILGALFAVGIVITPILQSGQAPTKAQWLMAIGAALAGLVAQDHKPKPPNTP